MTYGFFIIAQTDEKSYFKQLLFDLFFFTLFCIKIILIGLLLDFYLSY